MSAFERWIDVRFPRWRTWKHNGPTGFQDLMRESFNAGMTSAADICGNLQDNGVNVPFRELCAAAILTEREKP